MVFTVKNTGADFDHLSIEFKNDAGIEAGHETVTYDSGRPQLPRLKFQIAQGKTKVKDIVHAVESDPVASQVVVVGPAPGASEDGLVGEVDLVSTSRLTVRRSGDDKRPVQIVFPLWAARLLHFRGSYDGENGAKHFYMAARPGDDQFNSYVNELLADYKEATKQDPTPAFAHDCFVAMARRKQAATFCLGTVSYDEAQYDTAADYFKWVALETSPDVSSSWLYAAKYNLARTYEAAGRKPEAIKLLEEDDSPQSYGNRLRARQLKGS
jgi:tetratricopeptide (TPR) repeat protein